MISPYPLWMAAATINLCCDQGCDDNEYPRSMSRASSTGQSRVGGVLELVMSKVREETGRLSPSQSVIAYRLSSMMIRLS